MTMERDIDSSMAEHLTAELKTAVLSGDFVDQELLDLADNVLSAHQIYVQLLYVGMVVDRISQLSFYFDALDGIVEVLDTEDLAEATTGEKIRAVSALNQAVKTKVDIINNMMASKEAVGMLTANMRDTFGSEPNLVTSAGIAGGDDQFLAKLQQMPADQRQRVVAVAMRSIVEAMKGNGPSD